MTTTRMAVSIFSIIPIPGIGYSAMQTFMMYIALLGVGFVTNISGIYISFSVMVPYSALLAYKTTVVTIKMKMKEIFSRQCTVTVPVMSSQPSGADIKYASIMSKMSYCVL